MRKMDPIEEIKCRDLSIVVLFDGNHQYIATKCNMTEEPHGCQHLLSLGECPRGYGKLIQPELVM